MLSEPDLTCLEVFSNPTPPITGQQAFFNTDLVKLLWCREVSLCQPDMRGSLYGFYLRSGTDTNDTKTESTGEILKTVVEVRMRLKLT